MSYFNQHLASRRSGSCIRFRNTYWCNWVGWFDDQTFWSHHHLCDDISHRYSFGRSFPEICNCPMGLCHLVCKILKLWYIMLVKYLYFWFWYASWKMIKHDWSYYSKFIFLISALRLFLLWLHSTWRTARFLSQRFHSREGGST